MSHKSPLVIEMDVLQNALRKTIGIKNNGLNITHDQSVTFTTHSPISFTCKMNNNVSYHDNNGSFTIAMKNTINGKYYKIVSLENYDAIVSLFKYFKTR